MGQLAGKQPVQAALRLGLGTVRKYGVRCDGGPKVGALRKQFQKHALRVAAGKPVHCVDHEADFPRHPGCQTLHDDMPVPLVEDPCRDDLQQDQRHHDDEQGARKQGARQEAVQTACHQSGRSA